MDCSNGFNYQNQMIGSTMSYYSEQSNLPHQPQHQMVGSTMSYYSEQGNLPHPPQKPTKTKRFRSAFTTAQLTTLEAEYKKNEYVKRTRREEIAMELNLSDRQIKVWFQNKRMNFKRAQKNPSSTSTVSSPESVNSGLSLEEIGAAFEEDSVTTEVKPVENRYEMNSYPRPGCSYDMQPYSHYPVPACRYNMQPYSHYPLPVPCSYNMNSYQNYENFNFNNSASNFIKNAGNYNNNFVKNYDNNFVKNYDNNFVNTNNYGNNLDNLDLPDDLKWVTPFLSDQQC